MKIAISSIGEDAKSGVSNIFGRCSYFIVFEIENNEIKKIETIKNKNVNQNSGAGTATVQFIAENKIKAIITGNVGPKALDVLRQFNIKVYFGEGIVEDALQLFIENKLREIN